MRYSRRPQQAAAIDDVGEGLGHHHQTPVGDLPLGQPRGHGLVVAQQSVEIAQAQILGVAAQVLGILPGALGDGLDGVLKQRLVPPQQSDPGQQEQAAQIDAVLVPGVGGE